MNYEHHHRLLSEEFQDYMETLAVDTTDSLYDVDMWHSTAIECDYEFLNAYLMGAEMA